MKKELWFGLIIQDFLSFNATIIFLNIKSIFIPSRGANLFAIYRLPRIHIGLTTCWSLFPAWWPPCWQFYNFTFGVKSSISGWFASGLMVPLVTINKRGESQHWRPLPPENGRFSSSVHWLTTDFNWIASRSIDCSVTTGTTIYFVNR